MNEKILKLKKMMTAAGGVIEAMKENGDQLDASSGEKIIDDLKELQAKIQQKLDRSKVTKGKSVSAT